MSEKLIGFIDLVHIDSLYVSTNTPVSFYQVFSDDKYIWKALGSNPPEGDYSLFDLENYLRNDVKKTGYLLKAVVPVLHGFNQDLTTYKKSWGYVHFKWFYGETIEECKKQGVEWKDVLVEQMMSDAKVKAERHYEAMKKKAERKATSSKKTTSGLVKRCSESVAVA